jgi:hypothetical protein
VTQSLLQFFFYWKCFLYSVCFPVFSVLFSIYVKWFFWWERV